jgi:hypothetical protein
MKVGRSTLDRARRLQKNGVPELVHAVDAGDE